jgi:hypothetical protein
MTLFLLPHATFQLLIAKNLLCSVVWVVSSDRLFIQGYKLKDPVHLEYVVLLNSGFPKFRRKVVPSSSKICSFASSHIAEVRNSKPDCCDYLKTRVYLFLRLLLEETDSRTNT